MRRRGTRPIAGDDALPEEAGPDEAEAPTAGRRGPVVRPAPAPEAGADEPPPFRTPWLPPARR